MLGGRPIAHVGDATSVGTTVAQQPCRIVDTLPFSTGWDSLGSRLPVYWRRTTSLQVCSFTGLPAQAGVGFRLADDFLLIRIRRRWPRLRTGDGHQSHQT